eukprot:s3888_g3.t1
MEDRWECSCPFNLLCLELEEVWAMEPVEVVLDELAADSDHVLCIDENEDDVQCRSPAPNPQERTAAAGSSKAQHLVNLDKAERHTTDTLASDLSRSSCKDDNAKGLLW